MSHRADPTSIPGATFNGQPITFALGWEIFANLNDGVQDFDVVDSKICFNGKRLTYTKAWDLYYGRKSADEDPNHPDNMDEEGLDYGYIHADGSETEFPRRTSSFSWPRLTGGREIV